MLSKYLLVLAPLASAHFQLIYPASRGFEDSAADRYPCGGFENVAERIPFPVAGGPLQLDMGHPSTRVQVNMALGDGNGSYSIVLRPTFNEEGPGNFCVGGITFPSDLNVQEGQNATIQVITNGDPNGGLYQCADITFTNTPLTPEQFDQNCRNDTVTIQEASGNANGTNDESQQTVASSSAPSAANTGTPNSQTGAAPQITAAGYALGAIGVLGMVAAL